MDPIKENEVSVLMHEQMRKSYELLDGDMARVTQVAVGQVYFCFVVGGYEDFEAFKQEVVSTLDTMKSMNFIQEARLQ